MNLFPVIFITGITQSRVENNGQGKCLNYYYISTFCYHYMLFHILTPAVLIFYYYVKDMDMSLLSFLVNAYVNLHQTDK